MFTLAAMLSQVGITVGRYGFFGISGLLGVIIAVIVFIIVAVILWKIMEIVLPKLGLDAGWMQVIKLLCILGLFLLFLHFIGLY